MIRRLLILLTLLLAAAPVQAQVGGPFARIIFGADAGPTISSGTGSPEAVVTAAIGSVYLRTDGGAGSSVYFKESGSGNTGWVTGGLGGGGGSSHNLLSSTHTDTSANAVVRGATLVGNSTPAWSRLAIGSAGTVLHSDGTDVGWSFDGSALTSLNGSNIASGTVPDARLSANVSLFGASVDNSEITAATITFAKWASNSCATNEIPKYNGAAWACATDQSGAGGGADASASYLTRTAEGSLSNESNLGALTTGLLKITVGAGTATPSSAVAGTDYVAPGAVTSSGLTMATSRLLGRTTASTGAIEEISAGTGIAISGGVITATGAGSNNDHLIGITIDGGGSTITTGVKGFIMAPVSGTITKATVLSTDASATACSIVVDVWKDTYANYPPTGADSITASAKPTLSSASKSQDATLTGWTTGVTAGAIFGFNVDSVTACTRVTVMLTVTP